MAANQSVNVSTSPLVRIRKAHFVKLGSGGKWESNSINAGVIRVGYRNLSLQEMNGADWEKLKIDHRHEYKTKAAASMDINSLMLLYESTAEDMWITFYASHLFWCRVGDPGIGEDSVSRFRKVLNGWSNCDVHGNPLLINKIAGRLSKVQMFRAVICTLGEEEKDDLYRLINDLPSLEYENVLKTQESLVNAIETGIRRLHPKDFEILVDMVFSHHWQRISIVGDIMRDIDIELRDPITDERYQVQVKSAAGLSEFEDYAQKSLSGTNYRKRYFVVHSPKADLQQTTVENQNVELIFPHKLANLVLDTGLIGWLLGKIK